MTKKQIKPAKDQSQEELQKKAATLRQEIAKLTIEGPVNQLKDMNLKGKKRRELARILTIISEQKSV